jgi:hypothetical protein
LKNKYKVCGEYTIIYLDRKNELPMECYIDTEDIEKIEKLGIKWGVTYAKNNDSYYAHGSKIRGYIDGKYRYKGYYLHRMIFDKEVLKGQFINHINHNTLDNRKINLEIVSVKDNDQHRKDKNKNNKSGYRNVFWSTNDERWIVSLMIDGKRKSMGRFKYDELHEAGKFAEQMREKYYHKPA